MWTVCGHQQPLHMQMSHIAPGLLLLPLLHQSPQDGKCGRLGCCVCDCPALLIATGQLQPKKSRSIRPSVPPTTAKPPTVTTTPTSSSSLAKCTTSAAVTPQPVIHNLASNASATSSNSWTSAAAPKSLASHNSYHSSSSSASDMITIIPRTATSTTCAPPACAPAAAASRGKTGPVSRPIVHDTLTLPTVKLTGPLGPVNPAAAFQKALFCSHNEKPRVQ